MSLTSQHCVACEGGKPLDPRERAGLAVEVPEWEVHEDRIVRTWTCKGFQEALDRIVVIGRLAEAEGHHPDIHLTGYRHLRVELTTHAVGGLSKNDFILAAKIDSA